MTVDVKLWSETFPPDALPSWPCPRCPHGRLSVLEKPKIIEPAYSIAEHKHESWDPFWISERFVVLMKCNSNACGELAIVAGETELTVEDTEETRNALVSYLRPLSVFPGLPIISVPKETPPAVEKEIRIAFQLYWSDLGASASRLRTSVERMLDDFNIPRTRIDQKSRKRFYVPLAQRITLFKTKQPDHAESLDALRLVGNLGTHSDQGRQSLLAAFDVYEYALEEIYGKRSEKTKRIRKKLIAGKGKLK